MDWWMDPKWRQTQKRLGTERLYYKFPHSFQPSARFNAGCYSPIDSNAWLNLLTENRKDLPLLAIRQTLQLAGKQLSRLHAS